MHDHAGRVEHAPQRRPLRRRGGRARPARPGRRRPPAPSSSSARRAASTERAAASAIARGASTSAASASTGGRERRSGELTSGRLRAGTLRAVTERRRVLLAGVGDLFEEVVHGARGARRGGPPLRGARRRRRCATRSRTSGPTSSAWSRAATRCRCASRCSSATSTRTCRSSPRSSTSRSPPSSRTPSRTSTSPRSPRSSRPRWPGRASTRTSPGCCRGVDGALPQDGRATTSSATSTARRASRWARALFTAIFKPYDRSAALLFYGAMGLVLMLAVGDRRRDDRARPGLRRRALRLDEVARHGRPERPRSRRAPAGSSS